MDNVGIKTGNDAIIGTDEISGVHYQIVKIAIGSDGSYFVLPGDNTYGLDVDVTRLPSLPTGDNNIGSVKITEVSEFWAVFNSIAPSQNAYLFTLWNGESGKSIKVKEITVFNWQETTVSGNVIKANMYRITAYSGGTDVNIIKMDNSDTLPSGIIAKSLISSATEGTFIRPVLMTGEEFAVGGAVYQNILALNGSIIIKHEPGYRPLTIPYNEGITIKQSTNNNVGSVSCIIKFTVV